MPLPVNGNVNVHFTIEGEDAFKCAVTDIPTFLAELAAKHNIEIKNFRQEFFDKDNPQNRLGGSVVDRVGSSHPSEAKQFEKSGKPVAVFKGGENEKKLDFKSGKEESKK